MNVEQIAAAVALAGSCFDTIRNLIGTVKDVQGVLPDGEKKEAVRLATVEVEKQALLAEVQLAAALGYPLCRCKYPPAAMLKVGYAEVPRIRPETGMEFRDVHECPKCKQRDVRPGQGRIHLTS